MKYVADNNIKIIDNFIDLDSFNIIQREIMSPMFDWYIVEKVRQGDDFNEFLNAEDDTFNFQFIHVFLSSFMEYNKSNYYSMLNPIIEKLEPVAINRVKANCIPQTETIHTSHFHTDIPEKTVVDSNPKSAIFYVNDNDGYTLFENGKRVESVSNRVCIFPASMRHTGTTCTNKRIRVLINFIYVK